MSELSSSLGIEAIEYLSETGRATVRMTELGARVRAVEQELAQARAEIDRLRAVIAERDRRVLASEQHVHAERALRSEVERRLAENAREWEGQLASLRERVRELEHEHARMRRAVDEAEHLAAAAQAARVCAAQRILELARAELERVRPAAPDLGLAQPAQRVGAAGAAGPLEPERLSEALARLRERTPPAPVEEEQEHALPAGSTPPSTAPPTAPSAAPSTDPPAAPSTDPPAAPPAEPWVPRVLRRRRFLPLRRWLERARSG